MSLFSRTDQSFLGQWWWTIDRTLLASFLGLMALGVVLVATASPSVAETIHASSPYHFLLKHLIFLVPSLGLLIGVSMLTPRQIWRLSSLIFAGTIFVMIVVLFAGTEIKGAKRWIHFLGFSLQPSEFIKPAFAIVAAWLMSMYKRGEGFRGDYVSIGLYALIVGLLLAQPDLGMTVILTCIFGAQIFLAGIPFRLLIILGGAGIGALVLAYFSFDHVHSRLTRFFDPQSGDNYQVERALEAFQNGGFMGTGLGQGVVKTRLPDAHADFIFAVAGEEFGLFLVWPLLAVFVFILLRSLNRLMACEDMFIVLAVGGLLTMFGLQAFVHMGSALNILPAKGMTLPFISYGGSSLVSMGFSMGALLALTRRQAKRGVSRGGLSLRSRMSMDNR